MDSPSARVATLVGYLKTDSVREVKNSRPEILAGDEAALADGDSYQRKLPVEFGIVVQWDDAEVMWNHIFFDKLRVRPEERPVLLTEPPLNPKANRERTAEIMFRTFQVPALYLAIGAVLALYESGRTTGVVVESGHRVTHAVPIYEGYAVPHAILRLDVGGSDVEQLLKLHLLQKFHRDMAGWSSHVELGRLVREIKERHAYVAAEAPDRYGAWAFATDTSRSTSVLAPEVLHRLPNGKEILLRDELFGCAEALFDPSRLGFSAPGIGDVTLDAIMRCDPDLPAGVLRELFANVVLAGGTAMLPGFAERLRTELASRAPSGTAVHVRRVPEQGTCASWAGGATLASLDAFKLMWITKSEFDAHGPSIVHSKCF